MLHWLAQVEVLVLFARHVCQQPSTGGEQFCGGIVQSGSQPQADWQPAPVSQAQAEGSHRRDAEHVSP